MHGQSATPTVSTALAPPVRRYVSIVVSVGLGAGFIALLRDQARPEPVALLLWTVIGVWAQVSAVAVPSRRLRVSPSTTVYLAMILCLGPGSFLPPIWLSVVLGGWLAGSRVWYRLLFNAAQLGVAALLAEATLRILAPDSGFDPAAAWVWLPALLAGAGIYYVANVALVVGAVSVSSGRPPREVFLTHFGFGWELGTTAALCLLALPIAAGIQSAGLWVAVALTPALWGMRRLATALARHPAR
jgi:hypothetical protein